jgi:hypothetical protein
MDTRFQYQVFLRVGVKAAFLFHCVYCIVRNSEPYHGKRPLETDGTLVLVKKGADDLKIFMNITLRKKCRLKSWKAQTEAGGQNKFLI